ncbi:hypothetical protein ANME2D_02319 [Candidatus Methanoperedens nitroreducens]|uniref:Uncharacterized protein n=1 Tax=Candidatus Methanoperedens nitratireducens TaxID=1392998 RepID=A0A062V732_9EURY|nr:hypothetical protein [Candidatus Methanoperedens nitroreducens]KCZ71584.1 hypothetical protein ANME2D_02319 [Candidatus Methanoperedens nitroreducens]MDJ1421213.1 hypothetical protein [Candidatus Methanoperedens sp.]
MVAPTRAKHAWVKLYECRKEVYTDSSGNQTDFVVTDTPLLDTVADANNKPYHRVYANGAKVTPTSVTGGTKTYVITATGIANSVIEIIYPKTAKADMRIQQGIEYSTDATTDDWEELNSTVVTTDLVSRKGTGSVSLLRNNKTEVALIEGYADSETPCLLAIQDAKPDLTKAERTILAEVKFLGTRGSLNVGGKHDETFNFSFKPPVEVMAVT